MGRLVANHDFVKALLKFGTFDEYVFSNPSNANLRSFESIVRNWELPPERLRSLRFVPYFSLPGVLTSERFAVFHLGGWGYFMPGLHYLRGRYASNPWPITAVTHSLHGRHSVDFAVRLHTAGMARFDSIFCSSRDGRSAMANLLEATGKTTGTHYRGHLDWLPLGIDDGLLECGGDRGKARGQMRIPPEALVLLCLGRLNPALKMDLAPVLESLAKDILPNCRCPVYLVIAGGADSLNLRMVQELIREFQLESRCRLRANFRSEVKRDLLASADIFLSLPDNTQETFGLSLLEAQASSLPVIASRFDGYKDLVREAVDGYLIDTYGCVPDPVHEFSDLLDPDVTQLFEAQKVAIDMNQFAERLLELIHNDQRRYMMGKKGREKVASEFVFSQTIKRYHQRWDELFQEAQAHGLPPFVEDRFQMDYSFAFGHYVSNHLGPGDRVMTRPGQALCPSYNEVSVLLDPSELKKLLEAAANPITIKDLLEKTPLSTEQAWFAVMWLVKYNRLVVLRQEKGDRG
jgi:glycosyltransferase involved in cell wall biosynthesis